MGLRVYVWCQMVASVTPVHAPFNCSDICEAWLTHWAIMALTLWPIMMSKSFCDCCGHHCCFWACCASRQWLRLHCLLPIFLPYSCSLFLGGAPIIGAAIFVKCRCITLGSLQVCPPNETIMHYFFCFVSIAEISRDSI